MKLNLSAFRKAPSIPFLTLLFATAVIWHQSANAFRPTPSANRDTSINRDGWIDAFEKMKDARVKTQDPNYVKGRDIFKGRGKYKKYRHYQYCILQETSGDKVRLGRGSLSSSKEILITSFTKKLYDCNNPEHHILLKLAPQDAGLVVYYLNFKYNLKLKQLRDSDNPLASDQHQTENSKQQ